MNLVRASVKLLVICTVIDRVNPYACETLSLGLLFLEFKDAVREEDVNRVMCLEVFLTLLQSFWSEKLCNRSSYTAFPVLSNTAFSPSRTGQVVEIH